MSVSHQVGEGELRLALQKIVGSEAFHRSQQLCRLLNYLCQCLIAGRANEISEYNIGTEALGRTGDFDPALDAAVRVEMHRLRRRLRDYYEREGAADLIRIVLPPGGYIPAVSRTGAQVGPACEAPAETAVIPGSLPGRNFAGRRPHIIAVAAVVAIGLCVALLWNPPWAAATSWRSDRAGGAAANPTAFPERALRIGCGRSRAWTDRLGQVWGPDAYFEGGTAIEIPPRPYIRGAFDAGLYQAARTGTFRYRIPLPNGNYEMRLYFIEPAFGPENDQGEGSRMFNVIINGQTRLERFDIFADADGPWTADVRVVKDVAPDATGHLTIGFQTVTHAALVNAIEFVPAWPHVLNPIRLLPQDNFYTDSAGILWTPDNYSMGGRISIHRQSVTNTRDLELFRHERFGRFRYSIPVDHGSYSAYLYMAEEYWGPGTPAGGGEGSRLFSVFCNGTAILRGVDLFREAGSNYGVVRAFHHLTPNAQGKLVLSFEPERDYASLYALEVLDEAGGDTPSYERTLTGGGANQRNARRVLF